MAAVVTAAVVVVGWVAAVVAAVCCQPLLQWCVTYSHHLRVTAALRVLAPASSRECML